MSVTAGTQSRMVYIGVDDTDIIGSQGTGRLARGMVGQLTVAGLVLSLGVTRHQLLVDSRIRYTSHNSSNCIAARIERPITELYEPCVSYLESHFQKGADPGLCLCEAEQVNSEIIAFGHRATSLVLSKQDALGLAMKNGLFLRELGGTGDGVIGALAAVGLRGDGNNGRFLELRGIREVQGLISVGELLKCTDLDSVQDAEGRILGAGEIVNSMDWVRPSLVDGRPILRVKPVNDEKGRQIWLPIEARKGHKKPSGRE